MATLPAASPASSPAALVVGGQRPLPLSPALAQGRIEHRTLEIHGLPVRGAFQTVRTRPDGTEALLSARLPVAAPQLLPHQARIDPAAVPGFIAAGRELADEPVLEDPPRLVYLMILDQPVLAWESQLALTMRPEPSRPTVWVSAATGRVLEEVDQVRSSRTRIFAENPSATPEPIEVQLRDIEVEDAGHPLVGTRVQAFNCLGEETAEISPWWEEGDCYPQQTVFSDAQGDYFVPLPDVVQVEDNVAPQDGYAELSMYVHGELFLDAMKGKGIEQFQCELSSMLANVRTLEPSEQSDYSPLNNAYYTNQCDPERGPTMMFGQGSEVDFGYDADVIYHELGHGMVALLAPEGLTRRRLRPDGSLVDAGALNEALADYFSVMITDDPRLADYVGRFWSSSSKPYIRDAENTKTCPYDNVGQVHNDGEPFMASLWAVRKRLDAEGKEVLDAAVIEALTRMPPDIALEEAGALVLEALEPQVGGGVIDQADYDLLVRSFEARGMLDCPRVVTDPERVVEGKTMYLRRVDAAVSPFYPGPLQLRYEVPPGGDDLRLRFTLRPRSTEDPVEAVVLVRRDDTPIVYDYRLVAVDDPPLDPEEGDAEDPVRELVLVTGNWDLELHATEINPEEYELVLRGLSPGEVFHVALANLSPEEAVATSTRIFSSSQVPEGEEVEETDGGESGELPPVEEVQAGSGHSGCACRAGRGGDGRAGAGLLALLLLAVGRRRWPR